MTDRPEPWENPDPERYHFEAVVQESRWRVVRWGEQKRCRYTLGDRHSCKKPSVAKLNRSHFPPAENWWHYCAEHMFGRWVEDGQVIGWRLVENVIPPSPSPAGRDQQEGDDHHA